MFCGMGVGWLLLGRLSTAVQRLIMVLIWLLLFLLGVEAGSNPRIVGSITTLGLEALLLAVAGIAGSAVLAWALWRWSKGRKNVEP